jgi:hypothetical protein
MKLKVSVREMLKYMSERHQPKPPGVEDFRIMESEVRDPEPVRRPVWEWENAD